MPLTCPRGIPWHTRGIPWHTRGIVHWAVLWMFYYESWVGTGKWMGGGHGNWDVTPPNRKKNCEHL